MYAEFETGLRDYWSHSRRRASHPPMKDLLVAIASKGIPSGDLKRVDQVREYRNSLVHGEDENEDGPSTVLKLNEVRSALCTYFCFLPVDW